MLAVLLGMLPWAVMRAATDQSSDYVDFVRTGRWIVDNGYRHPYTALNRYLPSVDVACILLTLVPVTIGATIYYLLNVGTWFGLLRTDSKRAVAAGQTAARRPGHDGRRADWP